MTKNTLLSTYTIPSFEDIKPEDFTPAFDEALVRARKSYISKKANSLL
jgi:Zn-dependent oligopeptidase